MIFCSLFPLYICSAPTTFLVFVYGDEEQCGGMIIAVEDEDLRVDRSSENSDGRCSHPLAKLSRPSTVASSTPTCEQSQRRGTGRHSFWNNFAPLIVVALLAVCEACYIRTLRKRLRQADLARLRLDGLARRGSMASTTTPSEMNPPHGRSMLSVITLERGSRPNSKESMW